MAVIAIILSSALGALAGLIHFTVLEGTLLQGFTTYLTVAFVGSTLGVTLGLLSGSGAEVLRTAIDDSTQWDDWHDEENWRDAELEARHERDARPNRQKSA